MVEAVDQNSIQVTTASNDVALSTLLTTDGQTLSPAELVARFGLQEGNRLAQLDQETEDKLTVLNGAVCPYEAYWVNRLAKLEPLELPPVNRSQIAAGPVHYAVAPMPMSAELDTLLDRYGSGMDQGNF